MPTKPPTQDSNDPFLSSPSRRKETHSPVNELSPFLDSDFEDGRLMEKITDLSLDDLLVDSPFLPKRGRSGAKEFPAPEIRAKTPTTAGADELTKEESCVENDPCQWEDGETAIECDLQREQLAKTHGDRAEEFAAVRRAAEVVAAVAGMLQTARANVQELAKTAEQTENILGIWIHILKQTLKTKEVLESPDFEGGTEDARKIRQMAEERNSAIRIAQAEAEAAAIKAEAERQEIAAAAELAAQTKAKTTKRTTSSSSTKSVRTRGSSGRPPPKATKGSRTRVGQVH